MASLRVVPTAINDQALVSDPEAEVAFFGPSSYGVCDRLNPSNKEYPVILVHLRVQL